MDHRPKVMSQNYKTYRRKSVEKNSEALDQANIFQDTKNHIEENSINQTTSELKTFALQRHR